MLWCAADLSVFIPCVIILNVKMIILNISFYCIPSDQTVCERRGSLSLHRSVQWWVCVHCVAEWVFDAEVPKQVLPCLASLELVWLARESSELLCLRQGWFALLNPLLFLLKLLGFIVAFDYVDAVSLLVSRHCGVPSQLVWNVSNNVTVTSQKIINCLTAFAQKTVQISLGNGQMMVLFGAFQIHFAAYFVFLFSHIILCACMWLSGWVFSNWVWYLLGPRMKEKLRTLTPCS